MTTVSHYLVDGIQPDPLDAKKFPVRDMPPGATCFLTGETIKRGYHLWDIVPDSSSERIDLTHSGGQWMSVVAARAWKAGWNLGSRLIFEDGTHYHPLINVKAATKQGRAYWSGLIRDIWPARQGQNLLAIVATDFKKRVWPQARIGTLGQSTAVYVHCAPKSGNCAPHISGVLDINWPVLIEMLDYFEQLMNTGFSKPAIRTSLLHSTKAIKAVGLKDTMQWERELKRMRNQPEFHIAGIVAQKT